jgi:hypothetical protein
MNHMISFLNFINIECLAYTRIFLNLIECKWISDEFFNKYDKSQPILSPRITLKSNIEKEPVNLLQDLLSTKDRIK